ncbi:hypothetical protein D5086_031176 [Populus alba]|uniref:Uncharacterized protein n=1 Tax=Populus alba TaxID=43335 RepID=A0ACC4AQK8_POPAL
MDKLKWPVNTFSFSDGRSSEADAVQLSESFTLLWLPKLFYVRHLKRLRVLYMIRNRGRSNGITGSEAIRLELGSSSKLLEAYI